MKASRCMLRPLLGCGVRGVGVEEISDPFPGRTYIMYAREMEGGSALSSYEFASLFGSLGDFSYLCTRKRNERPCGDAGSLALRDL